MVFADLLGLGLTHTHTHRTVKKVGGWWWLGTCEVGDGGASGYFQFGTEGKSFVRVLFELWCGGDLHLAVRARC